MAKGKKSNEGFFFFKKKKNTLKPFDYCGRGIVNVGFKLIQSQSLDNDLINFFLGLELFKYLMCWSE